MTGKGKGIIEYYMSRAESRIDYGVGITHIVDVDGREYCEECWEKV